jgi:hypothetical protein
MNYVRQIGSRLYIEEYYGNNCVGGLETVIVVEERSSQYFEGNFLVAISSVQ